VCQYRVQQALLSHTPNAIHLLELLWTLWGHLYFCGMKCDRYSVKEMDSLLSRLLTKQSRGPVPHQNTTEGYGLELKEQINTFIPEYAMGQHAATSSKLKVVLHPKAEDS